MGKNGKDKFVFDPDKTDEDDPGLTNGQRAGWAEDGLMGFLKSTGEPKVTDEDSIRDLLADLFHLCDREDICVNTLLQTALADWKAER